MSISPPANIAGFDGVVILVVVIAVLFGSTQIPKLARSLGSAQKEFKKGLEEGSSEGADGSTPAATAPPAPPPVVAPPPAVAPPAPAAVPPPAQPSVIQPGESSPHPPGS